MSPSDIEQENLEIENAQFELMKLQNEAPVARIPREQIKVSGDPYATMAKGPRDDA